LRYNVSQLISKDAAMTATTMLHVRIDQNIKTQATQTLASMGLTVSDAVRVFLTRVVADQELPFAIKAPNAQTQSAMQETEQLIHQRRARFSDPHDLIHDIKKNS
jgi:DNA-damage-inducible protein J